MSNNLQMLYHELSFIHVLMLYVTSPCLTLQENILSGCYGLWNPLWKVFHHCQQQGNMFEVSEMAGGAHAPLNSTSITIKYQKDVSYAHSNVATVA